MKTALRRLGLGAEILFYPAAAFWAIYMIYVFHAPLPAAIQLAAPLPLLNASQTKCHNHLPQIEKTVDAAEFKKNSMLSPPPYAASYCLDFRGDIQVIYMALGDGGVYRYKATLHPEFHSGLSFKIFGVAKVERDENSFLVFPSRDYSFLGAAIIPLLLIFVVLLLRNRLFQIFV